MNTGSVRYKRGVVDQAKPGFARVRFDDLDGLLTDWLAVVHPKTQHDRIVWTLDVGEHVACLMDGHMEDGCIVGAIYSDVDVPPVSSANKFRVQFQDGGFVEYDRASGAMTLEAKGPVHAKAPSVTWDTPTATITGHLTVQNGITSSTTIEAAQSITSGGAMNAGGGVNSTGDVKADGVSLKNHDHGNVQNGQGRTSPPSGA